MSATDRARRKIGGSCLTRGYRYTPDHLATFARMSTLHGRTCRSDLSSSVCPLHSKAGTCKQRFRPFHHLIPSLGCQETSADDILCCSEVRHHGKTVVYDWTGSKGSQPAIQWAAFYSDCEHEVQKVQSGHRVTLTYNLYAMRGNGRLAECRTGIDYANLPLYKHVRALIVDESFMPSGELYQVLSTPSTYQVANSPYRWPPGFLYHSQLSSHQQVFFPSSGSQRARHGSLERFLLPSL